MYDIRRICENFKEVHSRYYVDINGCVYTSLSPNSTRIMVNGERININGWRKSKLPLMNNSNKALMPVEGTNNYFLLYDGTILQRLKTMQKESGEVFVSIVRAFNGNGTGNQYLVSRLVAGTFLGDVEGKEVHHIDRNRNNNKVDNLEILTMEEHRGKHNFKKKHN